MAEGRWIMALLGFKASAGSLVSDNILVDIPFCRSCTNSYDSRELRNTHEMVLKLHYERPTHIGTWTLNVYAPLDIVSRCIDYQRSDYSR